MNPDKALIAARYLQAPDDHITPPAARAWYALGRESLVLANRVREVVGVFPVADGEPYPTATAMFADIDNRKRLMISSLNMEHPMWDEATNFAFRVVHDYYGHWRSKGRFTWRGEIAAHAASKELYHPTAQRALYTEIIGQTAYRSVYGEFPPQKCVLLDW